MIQIELPDFDTSTGLPSATRNRQAAALRERGCLEAKAELPEVKKEDVKVTVENGVLVITGERRAEKEEKGRRYRRIERSHGSFVRSFTVPEDADSGKVGASFKDGLLIVTLPKSEKAKPLSVDVKGQMDYRAGQPGFEDIPVYPHNIHYTVHLESPASAEEIAKLHAAVERVCPILNLLQNPQTITGTVVQNGAVALAAD